MPTFKLTRGTRDRISTDRPPVPSARRYEDRVQLGPDGETVPTTCINCSGNKICGAPVWEGKFCLPHYLRKGLLNAGILRAKTPANWQAAREIRTYRKETDAIVAFFTGRLRQVRAETIEPVATFAEAYAVIDELWNFAALNRRQPSSGRLAAFVSFIMRQDYIARHGWYNRDWVGNLSNAGRKRKEAKHDSSGMEDDQVVQAEGIRRPDEAGLWPGDADRTNVEAGPDPLDDWDAPSRDERLPNNGAQQ